MVSGVGQQAAYAVVVLAEDLRPRLTDPNVREEVSSNLSALLAEVNIRTGRLRATAHVRCRPWNRGLSTTAA